MTLTKNTEANMIVDISFALILALPIAIAGGNIMTTSTNALEAAGKCGADVNQNQHQECVVDEKRKRVERIDTSAHVIIETYRYTNA